MRHVRHALPLALAATALFAAGCGDDDGDKEGQTSSPAAASTPKPAPADPSAGLRRRANEQTPFLVRGRAIRTARRAVVAKAPGGGPATYCSPTGDYCVGVNKRGGTVLLAIASLAFQGNYRLCIAGPPGRGCKTFRLAKRGQMYASTIGFTPPARGRYSASWYVGSTKLGRSLSFTA